MYILCNKIIENDTKKNFYPDVLFKHPFKENTIETCSSVVDKEDLTFQGKLIDMESSGIFKFSYNTKILSNDEENIIKSLINNLNLSCTMGNRLKQILTYYKLQHGDFKTILDEYIKMNFKR